MIGYDRRNKPGFQIKSKSNIINPMGGAILTNLKIEAGVAGVVLEFHLMSCTLCLPGVTRRAGP